MACHAVLLADFFELGGFAFAVILFVALAAMAVLLGSARSKRANQTWSQVGQRLGLQMREARLWTRPHLSGTVQGFPLEVDVYQEGQGKRSSTYTRVRVRFESVQLGLSLRREGFLNSITKMFGLQQDVEVGDAGFDAELMVAGSDPVRLRQFLNPARRMRIRRYFTNYPLALISDDLVTSRVSGMLTNADQLEQLILAAVSVAWHLSGPRKADENLTQALAAQEIGHTDEALQLLRQASSQRRPGDPIVAELVPEEPIRAELIEERLLEGELLTLAGRGDEAHRVFQEARQSSPYDEEIAEWAEQPSPGPKSDVAEAIEGRAEVVPEPPRQLVGVADLCNELFQEGGTSYQTNHLFDKRFAGASVRWTGKLKRVESFAYDFVFGSQPGTRAVVVVHELENAIYGDRTVSAIARFPPEAEAALRQQKPGEITFTGKLHKVDSLLRNFYLVDAQLQEG